MADESTEDASRRRIIDELIDTGVPAVAATHLERRGRPWLASLYMIVPLLAIAAALSLRESPGSAESAPEGSAVESGASSLGRLAVSAQNISFDTKMLTMQARAQTVIHFENRDSSSVRHNVALYRDAEGSDPIFQGEIIPGGTDIDYELTAPRRGDYFFQCDVHPSMNGTVAVER